MTETRPPAIEIRGTRPLEMQISLVSLTLPSTDLDLDDSNSPLSQAWAHLVTMLRASSPVRDDPDAICGRDVKNPNHLLFIILRTQDHIVAALNPLIQLLDPSNAPQFRIVPFLSITTLPGSTIQQTYFYLSPTVAEKYEDWKRMIAMAYDMDCESWERRRLVKEYYRGAVVGGVDFKGEKCEAFMISLIWDDSVVWEKWQERGDVQEGDEQILTSRSCIGLYGTGTGDPSSIYRGAEEWNWALGPLDIRPKKPIGMYHKENAI
ncbi:hypothetical protein OIDMADRAFT_147044 [Oidiodendron maius Zn]|uniref:Uncharacterized protein n=1 Tax=Oidiodendron maius (strain Zn) TaxID=913774 RepID=A0A0C3GR91_OIDMZ|nr:hypothetical protein OIDMADRAFT_147044 [Oidiodendron maius Zn]